MTIQKLLIGEIKKNEYLSYDNIEALAKENGFKIKTAERQLNPSAFNGDSPVETVKNGKGYIIGYKYKQKPQQSQLFGFNDL